MDSAVISRGLAKLGPNTKAKFFSFILFRQLLSLTCKQKIAENSIKFQKWAKQRSTKRLKYFQLVCLNQSEQGVQAATYGLWELFRPLIDLLALVESRVYFSSTPHVLDSDPALTLIRAQVSCASRTYEMHCRCHRLNSMDTWSAFSGIACKRYEAASLPSKTSYKLVWRWRCLALFL